MSDYVFKNNGEELVFVGDFEGLYKNDSDPWNQSGSFRGEYAISRCTQLNLLSNKGVKIWKILIYNIHL
jgi:hypothetical protein